MRTTRLSLAAALAAALALAAQPAAAQTHRDAILAQLNAVNNSREAQGLRPVSVMDPQMMVGMLPKGGSVILELNLRAGVRYFIPAGCDTDCDDLDSRILSPDGQTKLDEDVESDDVPLLEFTAQRTGPHLLSIMMASCKTDLCYFGFRVMGSQ